MKTSTVFWHFPEYNTLSVEQPEPSLSTTAPWTTRSTLFPLRLVLFLKSSNKQWRCHLSLLIEFTQLWLNKIKGPHRSCSHRFYPSSVVSSVPECPRVSPARAGLLPHLSQPREMEFDSGCSCPESSGDCIKKASQQCWQEYIYRDCVSFQESGRRWRWLPQVASAGRQAIWSARHLRWMGRRFRNGLALLRASQMGPLFRLSLPWNMKKTPKVSSFFKALQ